MKVLQINVDANNASTGSIARNIASLVVSDGGESYIAYGRKCVPSSFPLIQIGSRIGVWLHGIQTRLFDNHGLASRIATKLFIKELDSIKPDVVHLHNIHGYYLNYRILFQYLSKNHIPVVWTLHDCWSFTGHCAHFVKARCDKWKSGCYACPLKRRYPKSIFADASKRNYKTKKELFNSVDNLTIVPVSNWLRNLLDESFLRHQDIRVIKNGIDLDIFKPVACSKESLGLNPEKYTILGVANIWSLEKGLNEFIRLSKDVRYQVVLIGVDRNLKMKLPREIFAIRRTESQDVLACYYSVADVLVNPTYEDTYPTVNLEALSCGTPVVTYRTGGSPETLDEKTGVVVEQGDWRTLLSKVDEIVTADQSDVMNRRLECRSRALKFFDKKDRFADYLSLYCEILNN